MGNNGEQVSYTSADKLAFCKQGSYLNPIGKENLFLFGKNPGDPVTHMHTPLYVFVLQRKMVHLHLLVSCLLLAYVTCFLLP